ncbi:MAG: DUF3467 domain-containing protein [Phycisphaerales bacterium]
MAEQAAQQQGRQVQLRIDESRMNTTYANTIRTATTAEEVVLDFGLNMPAASQNNQPSMTFAVGSRVVMNWTGAKRLALSLQQIVGQYEKQFGTIELNQGQQQAPANQG